MILSGNTPILGLLVLQQCIGLLLSILDIARKTGLIQCGHVVVGDGIWYVITKRVALSLYSYIVSNCVRIMLYVPSVRIIHALLVIFFQFLSPSPLICFHYSYYEYEYEYYFCCSAEEPSLLSSTDTWGGGAVLVTANSMNFFVRPAHEQTPSVVIWWCFWHEEVLCWSAHKLSLLLFCGGFLFYFSKLYY